MEGMTESLRRQLFGLSTTYQQAEQGIEQLSGALGRRAGELASTTDTALGKVAMWDQQVRSHSQNLQFTTNQVSEQTKEASQHLERQTSEMREVFNEARALVEALKQRRDEAGYDDFMHQATFISERLQSVAVDMNRVLETTISEDDWKRFNKGERGIFVRKMLGFREKAKIAVIREKYQRDNEFRDYVSRYVQQFEHLLDEAKKRDQSGLLNQTFMSSDVGKVYMLLSRALGRDG